jgi:hypothetical protein
MAQKTLRKNPEFKKVPNAIIHAVNDTAEVVEAIKELQASEKELKAEIKAWAKKEFFKDNAARLKPSFIYDIRTREVDAQLDFVNKYHLNPERHTKLQKLLGVTTGRYFGTGYDVKISIAPDDLDATDEADFLTQLQDLCEEFGVNVTVEDTLKVKESFHEDRLDLPPNLNEKIDAVLPMEVQITI